MKSNFNMSQEIQKSDFTRTQYIKQQSSNYYKNYLGKIRCVAAPFLTVRTLCVAAHFVLNLVRVSL